MKARKRYYMVASIIISTLVMISGLSIALQQDVDYRSLQAIKKSSTPKEGGGRGTLTVYSDASYDHCLLFRDTNYYTAHDASTAQYLDWSGLYQMDFGQNDYGYTGSPYWYIFRYFAYFDTSALPDSAVITDVQFSFYCCGHHNTAPDPKLMAFYDPSGIYPHQPLQMSDFDLDHYSDTGAGYYTVDWLFYYTWTWNSGAYNKINKNGWTKIMFTTQADWQSNPSLAKAWAEMYSGDEPMHPPYLTIEYTSGAPGDPSNLNAYNPTTSSIDLSWTKGSGSDKTMIRRSTGSYPSSPSSGSQAYFGTGTSTIDTGLSPSTTYYYRAWAYDSSSGQYSTGYSQDYETTTSPSPPGNPSNLNAYNPTTSSIDLSWTKGSGSDKTMIRRSTGSYPSSPSSGTQVYFSTGTSTIDTGLSPSTTYYYRAWAYDSGTGMYSTGYSQDYETTTSQQPPGDPSNLNAYNPTTNSIDLSWTKGSGSDKTMIRRSTGSYPSSPSSGSQAYFGTGTSTIDTGLSPSTTYYYRAWAYDSGTGMYSTGYSQDYETTTSQGNPGDPSNLNAYNPTTSSIDLSWTKGSGADYTMIRRKTGSYPASPSDGSQAYYGTGTSSTDSGLSPSTTYYYRAWAYNSGTGLYSTGYSQDYETTTAIQGGDWTVIAYLCGDNNLGSWCQQCLNYMDNVGSQNGIEIVALIDGETGGDSRAYHVLHNNQVNIPLNTINPGWGNEVNMGDPQVLIDFSEYCIATYPADHYLIVPQDHGGSWVGCCWDDSGDNLNIDDLREAFQQIASNLGRKTDIVFFNDCLMNGVEIAYQLEPYVEYQTGSETISWTTSFNNEFETMLQYMVNNPGVSAQDLATFITNQQQLIDSASYRTQSVSSIELDRMQDLITAIGALASDLYSKLSDNTYRNQIETARTQSEYTEGPYGGQIERLIDLYDFVSRINTQVSDPVTQALAQDVLNLMGPPGGQYGNVINRDRHTSSANFCHGLSVYFPDRLNRYSSAYLIDNDFVTDTQWDEFLDEYLNGAAGVGYGWDAYISATGKTNGETYFTLGEDETATDGYDENLDVDHSYSLSDVELYSLIDSTRCSVDMKHGPDTEKTWNLCVEWEGSASAMVELSWDVSSIPHEEYGSVLLYDCTNQQTVNMRTSSSYSFSMNVGTSRLFEIRCGSNANNPPVKPQPPSGPAQGDAGVEYTYTAVTTDPDGNTLSYVFSWGDETTSQTPFMPSGQQASETHSWAQQGSYEIKVKAIDEHGAESDWSDPLSVSMPLNQQVIPSSQTSLFLKMVQQLLFNMR